MSSDSKHTIEQTAIAIFARGGYDALSMRVLAKESDVSLSSIYHFFADKDVLLTALFNQVNANLGAARKALPERRTAYNTLLDRVQFQFEHIQEIVFVLKYYLHYRPQFLRVDSGYVPPKAYLHIDEVIQKAIRTGEYRGDDEVADAKVMTHAINGFLLEYFPSPPKGRELTKLSTEIADFLYRSITNERRGHVLASTKKS